MKDLQTLSAKKLAEFINSFDRVLCDIDGVLWTFSSSIPGSDSGIQTLQTLGKKVAFVTNNTGKTHNDYHKYLESAGFIIEKNELITPAIAIIDYLQKINFNQKIYVIGMTPLRTELEDAGFQLAKRGPEYVNENYKEFAAAVLDSLSVDKIGAVIADSDVNLNFLKMQWAANFLKNPDVIFISGGGDKKIRISEKQDVFGPGYMHKILEDVTGRTAHLMAKPSIHFNNFIVEKLKINEANRVLFIGDSVLDDMRFATNCGYKKLLVLSGATSREELNNWTYPEELKPDYYMESLKILHDLFSENFK